MKYAIALAILAFVASFAALGWEIWIIHLGPQRAGNTGISNAAMAGVDGPVGGSEVNRPGLTLRRWGDASQSSSKQINGGRLPDRANRDRNGPVPTTVADTYCGPVRRTVAFAREALCLEPAGQCHLWRRR
jgi:hypothetical protein